MKISSTLTLILDDKFNIIDINHLLVRFQQLDNASTKEYQGSGLGLALVKKLANLLGGDAGVKSKI